MKVGVIFSGCGVYDGSEIHESVFTLLSLAEIGAEAICFAPDIEQHHVVNHINGEITNETRNVLVESARITRSKIQPLKNLNANDLDAIVLPGGFGAAKNWTDWAFHGADGEINKEVQRVIVEMVDAKKPIVALCMSPTTVAKALENSGKQAQLSVGSVNSFSPYEIDNISKAIDKTGAQSIMKTVTEICIDEDLKIISAPCYMMDASIIEVHNNIRQAINALVDIV